MGKNDFEVILMSLSVQYHNTVNNIAFKKFSNVEIDVFFAICSQLEEKGSDEVSLSFRQLKELSNLNMMTDSSLVKVLRSLYKKMATLYFYRLSEDGSETCFVIFKEYSIDTSKSNIAIKTNAEYMYLLNDLTSNFTIFEMKEFTSLRSKYSKSIYRLLKQSNLGKQVINIDEFRKLLAVPKSYKMTNIDKKILEPVCEELSIYFDEMSITKVKTGKSIVAFEFTWNK
ncbi:replication initiation protein [Enterococcus faecium]|uniref:replication initiation protein n=1 Tax=Enterococcus faecium TaxID=1352 RepID=UPI0011479FAE|nr:replication initiation protein [Enterococcus faecium]